MDIYLLVCSQDVYRLYNCDAQGPIHHEYNMLMAKPKATALASIKDLLHN